MTKLFALTILLFVSWDSKADDCQGTPDEIGACHEWQAADEKLNSAYRALLTKLDHSPPELKEHYARAKKSVVRAQRAWLMFREKDCSAVFDLADGTSKGPLATSCEAEHALLRVKQLETIANGI